MNYLAHACLSFHHPGILTGNLISDFVKGKRKFDFPVTIQHGIALHRSIDTFTDMHEATREAKEFFRPQYRLYSGAFVDVVYDHFLANDPGEYPEDSLAVFSKRVYADLEKNEAWFPEKFARMFPYMKSQDWLSNYRTRWGIEKSFGGLVRRAAYLDESQVAFQIFEDHYQRFEDCYRHFWASLKYFALQEYDRLMKDSIPGSE
jgi:acyl carrier protein phosphodiesterase